MPSLRQEESLKNQILSELEEAFKSQSFSNKSFSNNE